MAGKMTESKRPIGTGRAVWLTALLVLFGLLGMTGCSDNPVAPDTSANITQAVSAPNASAKPFVSNHRAGYGSGWVSPDEGGVIDLNWGSPKNELIVPAGAVDHDVFIEVRTTFTRANRKLGENFFEFEFSPDGQQFTTPATLVIQARALSRMLPDGGLIKLYWYNPATGEWEIEQSARVEDGRVAFSISHFSKFGVSD